MGLLKPATNQTAYLKLGLQGFEGSGKTFLACQFAMGLTKLVKGSKVAYFDTEKGSDFWIGRFKEANVQLDVVRSRAFVDLLETIKEAEAGGYSFLIIDSITHVWRELGTAYKKKNNRKRLTMGDWVTLKEDWAQFTDRYVNSKLHVAMCGRAGYEYDFDEDEDGKKEIIKTGTKMKAEGETGYEPDLLIETLKIPLAEIVSDRKQKKNAKGFINRCVILKDRSDLMNGKILDKPKFENFLSIIKSLNLGGEHAGPDATRTSEVMFGAPDRSWSEEQKQREIALEELQAVLVKGGLAGTAMDKQKARIEFLERIFGTSSKRGLEELRSADLWEGVKSAKMMLGQAAPTVANGQTETAAQENF